MCYYESESKMCSKTTISTVNNLHICWNLDVTSLYYRPVAIGAFWGSVPNFFVPPNFVVPRKVCFKHIP